MSLNASGINRLKIYIAFLFVSLAAVNLNAQTFDAENIQAIVEETHIKQKGFEAKLYGYKYTLKRTEQELDEKNQVKSEKVAVYQVFPAPDGTLIQVAQSRNGVDLTPGELDRERRQANKLWQKARKNPGKNKNVVDIHPFLLTSDFTFLRTENLRGRETVVLKFTPKVAAAASDSKKQKILLEGEVWIDLADNGIAKLDAKFSESFKIGASLLPAYLQPGTGLFVESSPLTDGGGLWATTRMEFTPVTKNSPIAKIPRIKQKEERTDYTAFDQTADKLFP